MASINRSSSFLGIMYDLVAYTSRKNMKYLHYTTYLKESIDLFIRACLIVYTSTQPCIKAQQCTTKTWPVRPVNQDPLAASNDLLGTASMSTSTSS
ncbi:unnamed protein product [Triticum turgidum subsp. durum]|uniref:Uncharacterized protein n=1 Tax=Triticum turgidum subsp. durum TaxID=4567 RepID=A0A9R1RP51_TRITD|nr:unnamed protein product [Triticum turgidum subsp. durum]